MRHDPIECREERLDLAFPPVQLLGDQQPVRRVVRAQREGIDATMELPLRQASLEIGFEARGGLVTVLGILGEEPHDDGDSATGTGRRSMGAAG